MEWPHNGKSCAVAASAISTHETRYCSFEMTNKISCANGHLQFEQWVVRFVAEVCGQVYHGSHHGFRVDKMTFMGMITMVSMITGVAHLGLNRNL